MGRSADLPSLKRALDAIGIREGTPESRAVGRVVRDLCDAESLPETGDLFATLDVTPGRGIAIAAHARRVSGRNLWVWYFANGHVQIVAVTRGV